ncbi:MAG: hypothetical protein AAF613_10110 [Pseudomonadota bacterium]
MKIETTHLLGFSNKADAKNDTMVGGKGNGGDCGGGWRRRLRRRRNR